MPTVIISAQTSAAESLPFVVKADRLPLGVSAFGLASAEKVVIHRNIGNSVFRAIKDASATMTATDPDTVIEAIGEYKLVKTATVGNAGASIG